MKSRKNQSGVAALEIFLIVVVLAIVGFVGWYVYDSRKSVDNSLEQTSAQDSSSDADTISNTSDVEAAEKTLDGVNPDENSSELSELDSEMSQF